MEITKIPRLYKVLYKKPSRDPCKLGHAVDVIDVKGRKKKIFMEMIFQGKNSSEPLNQEPPFPSPAK